MRQPITAAARARALVTAGAVAALAATSASCSGSPTSLSLPADASAGDLRLERCTSKIDAGKYETDCGVLVVPESWSATDSRLIALPVKRVRAISADPGEPIFVLQGGPGQSNLGSTPPDVLLANHDHVTVGYRGVDGSVVLDCPEVSGALKGVGNDLLSAESRANVAEAYSACAGRLLDEGIDLDSYTMLEVVQDMEAARAGLDYERLNLLSYSYGTRVAQVYAQLHPDRVHRSVMISVNPPGHFVWEPETIDRQLGYYADLCASDPECRARTPDLAETMRHVAQDMPRRWLFLPIDPGKVRVVTHGLLFERGTAAQVFDAYIAAEEGDPSGLALMSLLYDFLFPSALTWGDLAAKAVSADYDSTRDYATEMDPPGSILGSPFSLITWGSLPSTQTWPMKPMPAEFRQVQRSDVETLLVSGSIDFSTPAEFATEELLPHLANGRQVVLSEVGHVGDVWSIQRRATERLLASFFDTGVADESLYTYAPMDFSVRRGFPAMAKIALGLVSASVLAVVAAVWFVVRFIRRRRARRAAWP